MMLIGNWDLRSANTVIVRMPSVDGGTDELYMLSDVGTAFGRMGSILRKPTRWNLEHYAGQRLVRSAVGGKVTFRHRPHDMQPVEVPLDHAKWFVGLISQLSAEQVRQAFEAAGAPLAEIEGFSAAVIARIEELRAAVGEDEG